MYQIDLFRQETKPHLFCSFLCWPGNLGDIWRYLENSVLTKPCEKGHSASLPLDSQQTFCLLSRALEDLAHRCCLVAMHRQHAAGTACWLFSPVAVRIKTTAEMLSSLELLILHYLGAEQDGLSSHKEVFFYPMQFLFHHHVKKVKR